MNERPTQPHDGGQAFTPTHTAKLCERIAELEQELDDWRNAAKGAENPHPAAHMAAMKEAIREAHSALNNAAGKLANPYGICQDQTSDEYAAGLDCENALTKLKPFLDQ